jgi:hypothetical protein
MFWQFDGRCVFMQPMQPLEVRFAIVRERRAAQRRAARRRMRVAVCVLFLVAFALVAWRVLTFAGGAG